MIGWKLSVIFMKPQDIKVIDLNLLHITKQYRRIKNEWRRVLKDSSISPKTKELYHQMFLQVEKYRKSAWKMKEISLCR